jgi:hypothetical protein
MSRGRFNNVVRHGVTSVGRPSNDWEARCPIGTGNIGYVVRKRIAVAPPEEKIMSLRIAVEALASPPARVALAVIGAFAALFAVLLAVRPDMVMDVVHEVATMM